MPEYAESQQRAVIRQIFETANTLEMSAVETRALSGFLLVASKVLGEQEFEIRSILLEDKVKKQIDADREKAELARRTPQPRRYGCARGWGIVRELLNADPLRWPELMSDELTEFETDVKLDVLEKIAACDTGHEMVYKLRDLVERLKADRDVRRLKKLSQEDLVEQTRAEMGAERRLDRRPRE